MENMKTFKNITEVANYLEKLNKFRRNGDLISDLDSTKIGVAIDLAVNHVRKSNRFVITIIALTISIVTLVTLMHDSIVLTNTTDNRSKLIKQKQELFQISKHQNFERELYNHSLFLDSMREEINKDLLK